MLAFDAAHRDRVVADPRAHARRVCADLHECHRAHPVVARLGAPLGPAAPTLVGVAVVLDEDGVGRVVGVADDAPAAGGAVGILDRAAGRLNAEARGHRVEVVGDDRPADEALCSVHLARDQLRRLAGRVGDGDQLEVLRRLERRDGVRRPAGMTAAADEAEAVLAVEARGGGIQVVDAVADVVDAQAADSTDVDADRESNPARPQPRAEGDPPPRRCRGRSRVRARGRARSTTRRTTP